MANPDYQVLELEPSKDLLTELGALCARSFFDDPFFLALSDQAMLRQRGLGLFFRSHLKAAKKHCVFTGVRDEAGTLLGICVWQRPGTYPLGVLGQVAESLGALRALFPRPASIPRGLRYTLAMEKAHVEAEHWYLVLLAADPMVWRRGVGEAMLRPGLDRADAEGLPCYLETQKSDNLAYYRRFGFELEKDLEPVKGSPHLFTMLRSAR